MNGDDAGYRGEDGAAGWADSGIADGVAAEHAELALDDGAYLLGALDDQEQARFERHLLRCAQCQDALAELAGLPQLLDRLSIADLDEPTSSRPPETLLPSLLGQVATARRRRAWRARSVGFLAACLLVLLVGAGVHGWTDSQRAHPVAMASVGPNNGAVQATVTLTGSGNGVRIKLDCGYRGGAGTAYPSTEGPSYRMVVVNRLGQQRELGTWTAQPGEDVELIRDSPWTRHNLSQIEITDEDGVTVLQLSV